MSCIQANTVLFQPFMIGSSETKWDLVAGESTYPTLVLLCASLPVWWTCIFFLTF